MADELDDSSSIEEESELDAGDDEDQDSIDEGAEGQSDGTHDDVSAPFFLEVTLMLARLLPITASLLIFGFSLSAGTSLIWSRVRAAVALLVVSVFGWAINMYLLRTFVEHFAVKTNSTEAYSTQSWEA